MDTLPNGPASDPGVIRASAEFPRIAIEIVRHPTPAGDGEQISIHVQAMPSFAAFGRFVEATNPLALWMQWAESARNVFFPWLAVAPALTFGPAAFLPKPDAPSDTSDTTARD